MDTKQLFRHSALALAIASTLALAGCGGKSVQITGGNDSDGDYATASGVAAKGIIQHGLVEVWELDENGNPLRKVGQAETDDQGRYEAAIDRNSYGGGPLLVKVKARPGAKMICDVHGADCTYGQPVDLASDFEMEAVAPPPAQGEKVKVQVTPLTHMAAKRALASGRVDKDAVRKAIQEVSELVGVDILSVAPVDITKNGGDGASEDARAYAAFVAGAGKLALQAGSLRQGLQKLARSFEDGKFEPDDDIKIGDLISAVKDEAQRAGVQSSRLQNRVEAIQAVVASNGGSFDPEPGDASADDDVAKAKALLNGVRGWIQTLQDGEAPARAFGARIEQAGQVLDGNAAQVVQQFADLLAAVEDAIKQSLASGQSLFSSFTVTVGGQDYTVTGSPDGGGVRFTLADPSGTELVNLLLSLSQSQVETLLSGTGSITLQQLQFTGSGGIEDTGRGVKLEVKKLQAQMALAQPITLTPVGAGDWRPANGTEPRPGSAAADAEVVLTALGKGSFTGKLHVLFAPLAADAFRPPWVQPGDGAPLSPTELTLQGRFQDAGSAGDAASVDGRLTIAVDNAGQFDLLSILDAATGGGVGSAPGGGGVPGGDGGVPGGDGGAGGLGGDGLAPFENEDRFVRGTVSFTTELDLGGTAGSAQLTVTAQRTGFRNARLTATLLRGGRSLTAEVSHAGESPERGSVTFTSTDGAHLTLQGHKGALQGAVVVDGRPVGTIRPTGDGNAPLVRFVDGSFESLY